MKLANSGDIQRRILLDDQSVGADLDPSQRSRRLLEVVAAIKRFGQHDLGVVVAWLQSYGRVQPSLCVVEPVGKQGNPAQLQDRRIVLRVLGDDSCVDVASLGKLPCLEELSGGIGIGLVRLRRRSGQRESRAPLLPHPALRLKPHA